MNHDRKYHASRDSVVEIVAAAKLEFLTQHPEYKIFEGEIGSYVARAVQLRNEQGVARKEGFLQDAVAQKAYFDELYGVAKKEIEQCHMRFAGQLPLPVESEGETHQAPDHADVHMPYLI